MIASSEAGGNGAGREAAFSAVVCGLAPGPMGREAVRQAVVLAAAGVRLRLYGVRAPAQAPGEEEWTLSDAIALAEAAGINAAGFLLDPQDPSSALVRNVAPGELLVVGASGAGRMEGILFGRVSTKLAHEARGPVLIARRPPEGAEFPREILLASDGSAGSGEAAGIAATIAARHRSRVCHLHVGHASAEQRRAMASESAALLRATGVEPVVLTERGWPVEAIVEMARRERVSLVVAGSRGLSGVRALGSVSERVAHQAPCSVLLARPG
jgi:nucleotide-binding universal stress UspA family protein